MLNSLTKGLVPQVWIAEYRIWKAITISQWIGDLSNRVKFLEKYKSIVSPSPNGDSRKQSIEGPFWVGGMFYPEAFITATRQIVAQVGYHFFV